MLINLTLKESLAVKNKVNIIPKMKNILIICSLFIICVSCASPTVVNVIGPNDSELSCKELSSEITIANQYADEAQKAKKMNNPHNIGAVLFFLPGMGVTMKNVEEASIAAKDRALHLDKIKQKKNC
tara:strand:- start:8 stop:388 length:381 start_codon:yes stop_codon:yes gene_type:complete